MLIEWVKALVPLAVAIVPVFVAVVKSARETRATTAKQIAAVSEKLDAHIRADEWSEMKQRRVRILRFADEVGEGKKYSSEMWDDVLDDIDEYERYCDGHPDYHNNKGVMAMEFIKIEYMRRKGAYQNGTVEKQKVVGRGGRQGCEDGGADGGGDDRDSGDHKRSELGAGAERFGAGGRAEFADEPRRASGSERIA